MDSERNSFVCLRVHLCQFLRTERLNAMEGYCAQTKCRSYQVAGESVSQYTLNYIALFISGLSPWTHFREYSLLSVVLITHTVLPDGRRQYCYSRTRHRDGLWLDPSDRRRGGVQQSMHLCDGVRSRFSDPLDGLFRRLRTCTSLDDRTFVRCFSTKNIAKNLHSFRVGIGR